MDRRFNIPCVGGQNTMRMGFDIPGVVVKIPWVGVLIYHGLIYSLYSRDKGFDIAWIGGSVYQR